VTISPKDWTKKSTPVILSMMKAAEDIFDNPHLSVLNLDGIAEGYNTGEEELIRRGYYDQ